MLVGGDKLVRTCHYVWVSIRLPVGPPGHFWVLNGMNIGCPLFGEDEWNLSGMVWKYVYLEERGGRTVFYEKRFYICKKENRLNNFMKRTRKTYENL